ncbi:DNA polymerase ligase N-terminal domain-containing protein [Tautonia marina]|uniref:DNA polymerase ligase N-terminal domain-containing protein n=1 Tax=Tautonia marina TaxID=2653855 RepID=UPI0012612F47|nr:DNA polymerase ligase N-terminal domain-containing protein [Tautonia marina]
MSLEPLEFPGRSGIPPRFVLLEHRWNGVHWDLMLEAGPRLRTWALSRLPEPETEIDATSLPDHRVRYLDYEGPISHDRGTVRRVDRGTYEPILWTDDRVLVRFFGHQVIGEADLVRLGERSWRFRMGNLI